MRGWRAIAAVALVLVGSAAACSRDRDPGSGIRDRRDSKDGATMPQSAPASPPAAHDHAGMQMPERASSNEGTQNSGSRIPDPGSREIALTPDMIQRAGIQLVEARKGTATARLHLPGVVQPNAYKNLDVTSLVSGRITQVRAELGQRVMQNEMLATVYSPELADAQTAFIQAKAARDAHGLALTRTQRLYAIGAVSREELEKMTAEAAEMDRAQEVARSRLVLLGIPEDKAQRIASPADVITTFDVKAPIAGVITKRNANPGLNIDPSAPLFTVTDLSDVWVVADLYERDFATVGLGSPVTITTAAYPGLELRGRVNYIDPQVQAETRTAKLRAEVANGAGRLRLGMFVDVSIAGRSARAVIMVPKTAVQTMGTQSVVFVSPGAGRFAPRIVTPGDTVGNEIAISSGLDAGDMVVAQGAFFLRAERERLP
jgi:membrane fusion protein, heavy metal efflux system